MVYIIWCIYIYVYIYICSYIIWFIFFWRVELGVSINGGFPIAGKILLTKMDDLGYPPFILHMGC